MESPGDTPQGAQITIAQSDAPLERIGYGSCGSVWADSSRFPDIDKCESALALKRADGLPDRSLENEAQMHKHILSKIWASQRTFATAFHVNIPQHIQFLQPGTPSWNDSLPRLPPEFAACQALISERILPLPRDSRRLIVERFWNGPEDLRDSIVNDKRNEHRLIRPYLGRRRTGTQTSEPRRSMLKSISLRNYPLHIDQVEALGLPAHEYASAMADSLAFLLWVVEIDACDVEFVLARPRPSYLPSTEEICSKPCHLGTCTFTSGVLGPHVLWILDFDCCKKLPLSVDGVRLAAERFWRNDPFYPNPDAKCEKDTALWEVFKNRFLETSGKVMASKDEAIRQLPEQLIARSVETIGVYSKGVQSDLGTPDEFLGKALVIARCFAASKILEGKSIGIKGSQSTLGEILRS